MGKDKFAVLEESQVKDEFVEGSALKETKTKAAKKTIQIHGMNVELADAIVASGESFSNFAKRAIRKLALEEGII
ncbi:MAG: hypothetical protein GQ570_15085 [Helicobacteraceae bacterium]|nr:hypothetical protein [Helicobacteraceae bacterium]